MKHNRPFRPFWIFLVSGTLWLTACGAIQPGSAEIAFIRSGALWTIAASGGQPVLIANNRTILSFTWTPDHTEVVYRGLNAGAAIGEAALLTPANLFIIGVDGGTPLQISPLYNEEGYTQPWWSADGSRLLYTEQFATADSVPVWWVAQPDQPIGIARKRFAAGVGLPALAPDGQRVALISATGAVVVATPEQGTQVIAQGVALTLAAHSALPPRAIWRPAHQQVLYPIAAPHGTLTLVLTDLQGHTQPITTISNLLGYAWAPNGQSLLLWSSIGFQVINTSGQTQLTWDMPAPAMAYWSSDSRYVLSESSDRAILADLPHNRVITLLQGGTQTIPTNMEQILQVAGGSPWSPDSSAFVLVTRGGRWQNQFLATEHAAGNGLYLVSLSAQGQPTGSPTLLDWGEHMLTSWTTLDINTDLTP